MAKRLRCRVVEVIGEKKDFEGEVDLKLSELKEVISISMAVTETSQGTRYVALILYRDHDSWWG